MISPTISTLSVNQINTALNDLWQHSGRQNVTNTTNIINDISIPSSDPVLSYNKKNEMLTAEIGLLRIQNNIILYGKRHTTISSIQV